MPHAVKAGAALACPSHLHYAVEKTFQKFDPCEIDSSKCDDFLDQPDNAKALREGKGNNYRE